MPAANRRIITFYWNNIAPRLVRAQADVFGYFGFSIEQHCCDGVDHGAFLDQIMRELGAGDIVLFVDIDCIPLNRAIVERAFSLAESGALFELRAGH